MHSYWGNAWLYLATPLAVSLISVKKNIYNLIWIRIPIVDPGSGRSFKCGSGYSDLKKTVQNIFKNQSSGKPIVGEPYRTVPTTQ
jgi:hypothetical protein